MLFVKIGFIGLGDMGSLMASNLLDNYELHVYNRTISRSEQLVDKGAILESNPKHIVDKCDIVILMVSDEEACEGVLEGKDGIFSSENTNLTLINMSTITPVGSKSYYENCSKKGMKYIEAPVSGTLPHARDQNLLIFVGGDQKTSNLVEPILGSMGRKVIYIGEVGSAARLKLIINGILAVQTAILAEGLNLAKKCGLDSTTLLEIVNDSALGNIISKVKGGNMIEGSHKPLFRYKYLVKDLKYGLKEFNDRNIATPLISKTLETYEKGILTESESDFSAIMNVYQQS